MANHEHPDPRVLRAWLQTPKGREALAKARAMALKSQEALTAARKLTRDDLMRGADPRGLRG